MDHKRLPENRSGYEDPQSGNQCKKDHTPKFGDSVDSKVEDYSDHFPPVDAKALVFDCDGTIVDTMPNHFDAFMQTATEYGFKFTKELFLTEAGRGETDIIRDIFKGQGLAPIDFQAAVDYKKEAFKELCRVQPPSAIPPVMALIQEGKRRGLPMAVVSGSAKEMVIEALEAAGVKDDFEVIIGRQDYEKAKPDPEPYLLGAKMLGVEPKDCVGYEDAENAGIASILAAGYLKAEFVKDFKDYPLF